MLKKDNRLSGNKQIKEVFEKGKMRQSPLFGVLYVREEKNNLQSSIYKLQSTNFNLQSTNPAVAGRAKFGIVVSKKISKKAVERNRIRRKIYREVGEILPKINKELRVVFLVKKAILEASDEEIKREVKKSLDNI